MTARARKLKAPTLRDAFETEYARREMERRKREDEQRRLQAADLAGAEALHEALAADGAFLAEHGLTVDRRRYAVSLDHARYRISAYWENGRATVALSDKRAAHPGASPREQESVDTVEDALRLIAQFLVDETR
jgi:hypothetical protein